MSCRIFGDWGTSRLRLYRVDGSRIVDRIEGSGIGQLQAAPEIVLRDLLARWRANADPAAIVLAGMVGSRNGWREVSYVHCPAGWQEWAAGATRLLLDDIPVLIAPGLSYSDVARGDVMRGEETQIFGALAIRPDLAFDRHHIVLPGTHSKWAIVDDGRIVSFTTFLTGEMFALLRDHSTLLRAGATLEPENDTGGLQEGLARAASGLSLLSTLFEVRTSQLLGGKSQGWASNFLSGLLIGYEIKTMHSDVGANDPIYLIGEPALSERYRVALERFGRAAVILEAEACVTHGLSLLESRA